IREHEPDHERGVDNLSEAKLLQHLIGDAPDTRRRHVATYADVDPRPHRSDKSEFDLLRLQECFQSLQRGKVTAGMVADGNLLSGKLLGGGDRRLWRTHNAARRCNISLPPHRPDLLGGRLIDCPVTGTGNV